MPFSRKKLDTPVAPAIQLKTSIENLKHIDDALALILVGAFGEEVKNIVPSDKSDTPNQIREALLLLPSPAEYDILDILARNEKDMYAIEIFEASEGKVKKGSLYVCLQRLQEKGFIESSEAPINSDYPSNTGNRLVYYHLNKERKRELDIKFDILQKIATLLSTNFTSSSPPKS